MYCFLYPTKSRFLSKDEIKVRIGEPRTLHSFPTSSGSGRLAGRADYIQRNLEVCADCRTQAISVAGNNKQEQLKTASSEAWRVFGALAFLTRWEATMVASVRCIESGTESNLRGCSFAEHDASELWRGFKACLTTIFSRNSRARVTNALPTMGTQKINRGLSTMLFT